MSKLYWRGEGETSDEPVDEGHPLPAKLFGANWGAGNALLGSPFTADLLWKLAVQGRLFISSDADFNDLVTGTTTLANTTPTFLLDVPAGAVALPLFLNLVQTGTVAGGDIDLIIEIDKVKRYSTGGTSEKIYSPMAVGIGPLSKFYTLPTAVAGYGVRLVGEDLAADVSPAEGAIQGPFWKPEMPYFLPGPASFLVFTNAGTTGPSWYWSFGWAEFRTDEITGG